MSRLPPVPLIVVLMGATALAMLAPAGFALATGEDALALVFAKAALLVAAAAAVLGAATAGYRPGSPVQSQVLSSSPIAGQRIRDVDFPDGTLVGALMKKGQFVKPRGSTPIEVGDLIVIFALADDVPEVERLVQVSVDYF